jgi:hypothetical protein
MITKSLAVFGDELFPGMSKETSAKKKEEASYLVTELFKHTKPELIYVMPTRGANAIIPLICNDLNIPYVIVAPYKNFYNEVTTDISNNKAMQQCKSYIVISEAEPETPKERIDLFQEATDFCASVALATLFIHSYNPSIKFIDFMNGIVSREGIKSWELVYGCR